MKKVAVISLLVALPALAQQPKFDIADVHISTTPRWFGQNNGGLIREGRYVNREATMLNLIEAAYDVTEDTVAGGPNWLDTDLYDVIAKVPGDTTPAAAKLMLQALLAERFGLVVRKDTRPMPLYVLSIGKGGSKLKRAAASSDSGCRAELAGVQPGAPIDLRSAPNLKAVCHNLTGKQITENLRQLAQATGNVHNTYLPREVADQTGLEGAWDFELEFTPIAFVQDKGRDAISLFDAVNKQLGLSLDLKEVPVPALVVESVNRKPTPNPPSVATDLGLAEARFEVAAVKPVNPGQPIPMGLSYRGGSEMRVTGTLHSLMAQAFQIQPNAANDKIVGLPKSADSQVWDITAKLPSTGEGAPLNANGRVIPPQRSIVMEMLRGLLADQFELKTHTENREVTVYVMTVAGGKPKMTQADGSERMSCKPDPAAIKPVPGLGTMVNCRNITMPEFAENLEQASGFFDHPIVDGTGLQGGWNFLLGWSRPQPLATAGAAAGDASEPVGLSSYEALEKEIGLKLVKQKRSIPVVVVDHLDEKPVD